ncbi:hypothetical protein FNH22_02955 [Fulvivirga sp. M361]|uniref:hypothetical protein n=1 Tax=Fulvivirga sp. M361 TaxID=2594266 RepID=UPI00117B04E8|nr:hypothetical protein [Fulvivirga sp. M361]TRX61753.1 hypothetical protein FNH22_02955 [Fulvivirga sp. M361]
MKYNFFNSMGLFLIAILFITSCSDDDDSPTQATACSVLSLSFDSMEDLAGGGTETVNSDVTFTYNSEGNITSIKEDYDEEICQTPDDCVNDPFRGEVRVIYDGDLINGIRLFEDGQASDDTEVVLTYDANDRISVYAVTELNDGVVVDIDEYRFIYENDKVVKVEFWEAFSADEALVPDGSEEFTYTGNNITKVVTREVGGEISFEINTSYDDKTNPFFNQIALFAANIAFDETFQLANIFSENNPVSIRSEDFLDQDIDNATVTYQYNEFNVPTSIDYDETDDGFDASYTGIATINCN